MSDRSVDDVEVDSAPAGSRLELGEPSTRFAAISPPGGLGSGRSGALIAAPARRTLELQNVFFSSTFRAKATSSRELFRWEISQSKNIVYPKKRLDQLYLFYSRFLLWFARLNSYLDGRGGHGAQRRVRARGGHARDRSRRDPNVSGAPASSIARQPSRQESEEGAATQNSQNNHNKNHLVRRHVGGERGETRRPY